MYHQDYLRMQTTNLSTELYPESTLSMFPSPFSNSMDVPVYITSSLLRSACMIDAPYLNAISPQLLTNVFEKKGNSSIIWSRCSLSILRKEVSLRFPHGPIVRTRLSRNALENEKRDLHIYREKARRAVRGLCVLPTSSNYCERNEFWNGIVDFRAVSILQRGTKVFIVTEVSKKSVGSLDDGNNRFPRKNDQISNNMRSSIAGSKLRVMAPSPAIISGKQEPSSNHARNFGSSNNENVGIRVAVFLSWFGACQVFVRFLDDGEGAIVPDLNMFEFDGVELMESDEVNFGSASVRQFKLEKVHSNNWNSVTSLGAGFEISTLYGRKSKILSTGAHEQASVDEPASPYESSVSCPKHSPTYGVREKCTVDESIDTGAMRNDTNPHQFQSSSPKQLADHSSQDRLQHERSIDFMVGKQQKRQAVCSPKLRVPNEALVAQVKSLASAMTTKMVQNFVDLGRFNGISSHSIEKMKAMVKSSVTVLLLGRIGCDEESMGECVISVPVSRASSRSAYKLLVNAARETCNQD